MEGLIPALGGCGICKDQGFAALVPRVSDERAEHKAAEAAGNTLMQEMQKLLREDRVQGGLGNVHLWKGPYIKCLGAESRRDQAHLRIVQQESVGLFGRWKSQIHFWVDRGEKKMMVCFPHEF